MTYRPLITAAAAFGLAACTASDTQAVSAPTTGRTVLAETVVRPNIVFIMSDDQGWGDTGYQGHPTLRTPNLDAMAAAGVRLDRFYAQSPVCSPTRASVLTGRHPYRTGVWRAADKRNFRSEEVTLAEVLAPEGYRTGMFGKWHFQTPDAAPSPKATRFTRDNVNWAAPWDSGVGEHNAVVPWEEGFDTSFVSFAVIPTYNPLITPEYYDVDYLGDRAPGDPWGHPYYEKLPGQDHRTISEGLEGPNPTVIVDAAQRFIEDAVSKDEPFLAYVWFHTPHRPIVAGARHRGLFPSLTEDEQHWHGALAAMDEEVGRVRALLRDLGVAEDTLVFFASDNGPSGCRGKADRCLGVTNGLRGRKASVFEGGVRVPGIAEWPGTLAAGTASDAPISTSDYYPTVLSLLGIDDGHDRSIDGIDVMATLEGGGQARAKPIYFRHFGAYAMIDGDWKIVGEDEEPVALFDLAADPNESDDLSALYPERTRAMLARFEEWETAWKEDLLTR